MHNLPIRILSRKIEHRASAVLARPSLAAAALLCAASAPAPAAVQPCLRTNLIIKSIRILPVLAAALIFSALSAHAQDVAVSSLLTDVPAAGGAFDYTLTLQNTGSEAIESLWLGWALSSNPVFDIASPTEAGNNLGWASVVDGDSVQYGGSPSETFLAPRATAAFTFDSTSTPAEFMSKTAGQSVVYGVDASPFAIEDDSLNSVEFAPSLAAVPEPSAVGLLMMAATGISFLGWRRRSKALSPYL